MADKKRAMMPSAIRFYLRSAVGAMMGDDQSQHAPFTEADLTEEELEAVREAVENAKKDGRNYIQYGDYPTKGDWTDDANNLLGEVDMLFNDPGRSAMYTLGMASFDEDGTVTDSYDFGAPPEEKIKSKNIIAALASRNPRAPLNLIGNAVGLRSGQGRKVSIRTKTDEPD